MATDKEHSTNDEVNRDNEFQKRVDLKSTVIDFLKETLETVTDSVFKKAGFKKNTKIAGEYGNGSTYGAGAVENQYVVTIAGKTNTSLTKKVIMDSKSISSDIEIAYKDNVIEFVYKTTEQGFFRGVDKDKKSYMVHERFSLDSSDITNFKKELKEKLQAFAEKEYGYITNTKLGVTDKTDKSTSSVVENTTKMKKLTIKELYELDFESDVELNSDKIQDLNTLDLKNANPPMTDSGDKKIFFDDAALNETDGCEEVDESTESINEVTTSGPAITGSEGGHKDGAQSGAGGYKTPDAWKKTNYAKKQQQRPKVTRDYKVVAQEEENKEKEAPKSETKSASKSNVPAEQPSNKNNGVEEPKSEENFNPKSNNQSWKDTNQSKAPKTSNDGFWTEVDLNPGSGYVPKGMEQNYVAGMHNASAGDMKKRGYAENTQVNLTKKKFFSLTENQEKGINKRYLITEKTSDQYEKERWNKLSNFKSRESIKEAEEMTNFFESLQENKDPEKTFIFKKALTENVSYDDIFNEPNTSSIPESLNENVNSEETIEVEKTGSKFGLTYKFFKKDFLNENKKFILDIKSQVYVKNPNSK